MVFVYERVKSSLFYCVLLYRQWIIFYLNKLSDKSNEY